jgi:Icc-related predicted phosphoesterase
MRVAAVGDLHVGPDSAELVAEALAPVTQQADVLLLAGDLTRCGEPSEAKVLADALRPVPIPVVAVLGNHDHHADRVDEVVTILTEVGVTMLEGDAVTVDVPTRGGDAESAGEATEANSVVSLGVAGTKGFGGGFSGASAAEFGETEMKTFARSAVALAARLERSLRVVSAADRRVALLHYAPIRDTLRGEHPELYPFLGSYLLGEAIDRAGADLVLHGHAHHGAERGRTPGGIPVRNVAQPVLRSAYRVFDLAAD